MVELPPQAESTHLSDDILREIFILNASDTAVPLHHRLKTTISCLNVCRLWYPILMDHAQVWGRFLNIPRSPDYQKVRDSIRALLGRTKGAVLWIEVDFTPGPVARLSIPAITRRAIENVEYALLDNTRRVERLKMHVVEFDELTIIWRFLSGTLQTGTDTVERRWDLLKELSILLQVGRSESLLYGTFWDFHSRFECSARPIQHAPSLHTFSCDNLAPKVWPTNIRELYIAEPHHDLSCITLLETMRALAKMVSLERLSISHKFKPDPLNETALKGIHRFVLPRLQDAEFVGSMRDLVCLCGKICRVARRSVVVVDGLRELWEAQADLCDAICLSTRDASRTLEHDTLDCTFTPDTFALSAFCARSDHGTSTSSVELSIKWPNPSVEFLPGRLKIWELLCEGMLGRYDHVRLSIPDKRMLDSRLEAFRFVTFTTITSLEVNKSTLFWWLVGTSMWDGGRLSSLGEVFSPRFNRIFRSLGTIHLRLSASWEMSRDEDRAVFGALRETLQERRKHTCQPRQVDEIWVYVDGEQNEGLWELYKAMEGVEGVVIKQCEKI
ncbi:hypothetical protein D9613_001234 [Agrocybe pediades]|uniref:F-box domain-containing protein n=1 Tax=Agrocybe pediades TaxID=84607 RepID=A0A8H4VUR0_9AGAR|nr:hypothetical protein D9613_001234 [Agrocybe pediades]